jgi:hypothetical protein
MSQMVSLNRVMTITDLFGAQCRITNSLAVRSSFLSSKLGSRCLDIASYDKKEEVDLAKKQTFVVATNLTLVNNKSILLIEAAHEKRAQRHRQLSSSR